MTQGSMNLVSFLQNMKGMLGNMPEANQRVLKFVIGLLVRLSEVEDNKMGATNLATCFGANILRPKEQTIESTLAIPQANCCVEYFIKYFDILFCEPVQIRLRKRKNTTNEAIYT